MKHNLGREEAIRRIDRFLTQLTERPISGGISIINPEKSWSDNVMTISFRAKKGFLGVDISGSVTANDDSVVIDIDVPAIITSFVSEDEIRTDIVNRAEALLTAGLK